MRGRCERWKMEEKYTHFPFTQTQRNFAPITSHSSFNLLNGKTNNVSQLNFFSSSRVKHHCIWHVFHFAWVLLGVCKRRRVHPIFINFDVALPHVSCMMWCAHCYGKVTEIAVVKISVPCCCGVVQNSFFRCTATKKRCIQVMTTTQKLTNKL